MGCGRSWVRAGAVPVFQFARGLSKRLAEIKSFVCIEKCRTSFPPGCGIFITLYKKVENISMAINKLNQINVYIMNINELYKSLFMYNMEV